MLKTIQNIRFLQINANPFLRGNARVAILNSSHLGRAHYCQRQYPSNITRKEINYKVTNWRRENDEENRDSWFTNNWLAFGTGIIACLLMLNKATAEEEEDKRKLIHQDRVIVKKENFSIFKDELKKRMLIGTLEFEFALTEAQLNELYEIIKENIKLQIIRPIRWQKDQTKYQIVERIEKKLELRWSIKSAEIDLRKLQKQLNKKEDIANKLYDISLLCLSQPDTVDYEEGITLKYLEETLKVSYNLDSIDYDRIGFLLEMIASINKHPFNDDNKCLEYLKQVYSIYYTHYKDDDKNKKLSEIFQEIDEIQPEFFKKKHNQACLGGTQVGPECRYLITSRGEIRPDTLIMKQHFQEILDLVVLQISDKSFSAKNESNFSKEFNEEIKELFNAEWGIAYENYQVIGDPNEMEMLYFEAINLGIMMKLDNKPYEAAKTFTRENPMLVRKIAVVHPEFFVDGSIVEACIEAMPHDMNFQRHLYEHVKYMGMRKVGN